MVGTVRLRDKNSEKRGHQERKYRKLVKSGSKRDQFRRYREYSKCDQNPFGVTIRVTKDITLTSVGALSKRDKVLWGGKFGACVDGRSTAPVGKVSTGCELTPSCECRAIITKWTGLRGKCVPQSHRNSVKWAHKQPRVTSMASDKLPTYVPAAREHLARARQT